MRSAPRVSNVFFRAASPDNVKRGLLGWVELDVVDLRLDVALRKTRDGRLSLSFPERTDVGGTRRSTARPLNAEARENIESQVFAVLREREWL